MAEEWSFLLSESTSKPQRRSRGPGRAIAAVAVVAVLCALGYFMFRGEDAEVPKPHRDSATAPVPHDASTDSAIDDEPAAPVLGASIVIETYTESGARLAGIEMLRKGEIDAAVTWLNNFLSAPTDDRDDQALFALAMAYRSAGRAAEAEDALRRLIRLRSDSLHAGDGCYELALMLEFSGRPNEAEKYLHEAVRIYPRSRGGRLAARRLADGLYDQHVEKQKKRTEWERIRDLYSIALPSIRGEQERSRVIGRLDELNQWIIFTAYARPVAGYPTNIVFHTVNRGETIGLIAKKYGVTEGSVKRLNGIAPESNVIRPGDELKILRGRTEIKVDLNTHRMNVWINGSFFREYTVGVGREGRTPPGQFKITSRLIDPDWWYNNEVIPPGDERNILGTRWLGFEKQGPGRGIGIHGSVLKDGEWNGIGASESNGCIRMRNPDAEELFDFAPIGTEVTVIE
jgi:lipoprotein-anchoring transpeptidase ErfK/SrfK